MDKETNSVYSVRDVLGQIQREQSEGFTALNVRLDRLNGRVRDNELAIAVARGRAGVLAVIAALVGSIVSGMVVLTASRMMAL